MMNRLFFAFIFSILFIGNYAYTQEEPQIGVVFLENDNLAEVNINQESFIEKIGLLIDLVKLEFATIPKDQKVAIHIVAHKEGKPTLKLYAIPSLDPKKQESVLAAIETIQFDNTKMVDFPMAITVNLEDGNVAAVFEDIPFPEDQRKEDYANGDLAYRYQTTKNWAISEVLPVLSAFELQAEKQFEGVQNIGKLIAKTDFTSTPDHQQLFSANADYWRGVMEMSVGNELISASNIFALIAEGKFDIALDYLQITLFFSDSKSNIEPYLNELYWRLGSYNERLNEEIGKGIAEHDKGNYPQALEIYNRILKTTPNSAWANYELYFTQNEMEIKNGTTKMEDRSNWKKAKLIVYACDPMYGIEVSATNAEEGYTLYRRQEIHELFKVKSEKLADVYKLGDIALDLSVYDYAAQLYWYSFTYSKAENKMALSKFLYCLEKLGVTGLKDNFNGNHPKEFKAVEKERQKAKEQNIMYKSFKK